MKNMKRIHKVVIKRMIDESPDTSWLGEYGNRAESDYAIDRQHAIDCPQQTYNKPVVAIEQLERAISYLELQRRIAGDSMADNSDWEDLDEALDVLSGVQDSLVECNCDEHGDMERNQYRYFNPNHQNYTGEFQADIIKYCLQDYARMESLDAGDFCFIGIRADAEYSLTGNVMQEATSGGLWGIESDSSPEYLKEIEREQLSELREQLKAIGFSSRAISAAFQTIERAEE
jgi:hypothetical protein